MNNPDGITPPVRSEETVLCITLFCNKHAAYIVYLCKACYAPLMRQGLDNHIQYKLMTLMQNYVGFRHPEYRFPIYRNRSFFKQEYSKRACQLQHAPFNYNNKINNNDINIYMLILLPHLHIQLAVHQIPPVPQIFLSNPVQCIIQSILQLATTDTHVESPTHIRNT